MSEPKTMYQRAEYSFGSPIEKLEVTRQTEKCYWVVDRFSRRGRETRKLKASNPPLRETWEEAKQDWVDFCARKFESKKRVFEKAWKALEEARALENPEDSDDHQD